MFQKRALGVLCATCLVFLNACAGPLQWRHGEQHKGADSEVQRQALRYFIQAKVAETQRDYTAAIVALRNAADLDPESPTIFAQLARNYDEIDDYLMAERFAQRALEIDPSMTSMRYLRFRLFERGRRHDLAAAELEAILEYEPDNWPLYSLLARLYLETDRSTEIAPLFERLLQQGDTPAGVKVTLADVLSRSGDKQKAEAVYRAVLEEEPDFEDAYLGLAEIQLAQGKRYEGIQYYRQAARMLPESSASLYELARLLAVPHDLDDILAEEGPDFHYRLGVALAEKQKYELATLLFEHIVQQRPQTVEEWLNPVSYYLHVEDLAGAEKVLRQATQVMPDSIDLYLFWGDTLVQAGKYAEATAVYQQGLEHNPTAKDLYLYWGFALERQKDWEAATQAYRLGLTKAGLNPELYTRWGIALSRQDRWQDAISRYRKAAELDSLSSVIHLHWGIALERQERWAEAIERLDRAARLDPESTYSLFYLGSTLEQAAHKDSTNDYLERSIAAFKKLLTINPNDPYALNYLGYMYADQGINLEEAVALLLKAISLEPENSAFFDSLGWAYFRLGDLAQAEHYLEQALSFLAKEQEDRHEEEELSVIFDHAGDVAQALGKSAEAEMHWRRALELMPSNKEVQLKLKSAAKP
jgi:tetratricopeptide (TPR) repeat protein